MTERYTITMECNGFDCRLIDPHRDAFSNFTLAAMALCLNDASHKVAAKRIMDRCEFVPVVKQSRLEQINGPVVYFMDVSTEPRTIKIGKTYRLSTRHKQLCAKHDESYTVLAYIPCGTNERMDRVEGALHFYFAQQLVDRAEYFDHGAVIALLEERCFPENSAPATIRVGGGDD